MPFKKTLEKGSLYVITDFKAQRGKSHLEVLTDAIRGGASVIQLRDKESSDETLISIGKRLRKVCDRHHALLIVNERVFVAKAVEADGLHIGQGDLSVPEARRLIGKEMLLGVSTHDVKQARRAAQEGADYIGVGPIFKTPTKPDYPPVGTPLIQEVCHHVPIPFVAIGGITLSNLKDVLEAGAYAVAVVRAVVAQENVFHAAHSFRTFLDSWFLSEVKQ